MRLWCCWFPLRILCETKCHTTLCLEGFFSRNLRFCPVLRSVLLYRWVFHVPFIGSKESILPQRWKLPDSQETKNSLYKAPIHDFLKLGHFDAGFSTRVMCIYFKYHQYVAYEAWCIHSMWSHRSWVLDEAEAWRWFCWIGCSVAQDSWALPFRSGCEAWLLRRP